jgi:hypothetical protein
MNYPNFIGLQLTEDYSPLIAEIDEIAKQCDTSRSAVIRMVLCDVFNFTPGKAMNERRSMTNKIEESDCNGKS